MTPMRMRPAATTKLTTIDNKDKLPSDCHFCYYYHHGNSMHYSLIHTLLHSYSNHRSLFDLCECYYRQTEKEEEGKGQHWKTQAREEAEVVLHRHYHRKISFPARAPKSSVTSANTTPSPSSYDHGKPSSLLSIKQLHNTAYDTYCRCALRKKWLRSSTWTISISRRSWRGRYFVTRQ